MNSVEITFFVPCYNEEGNIGPTLEKIVRAITPRNKTYEILLYDDGSTDGSIKEIENFQKSNPTVPLSVYKNKSNVGLGVNYRKGIFEAKGLYYFMVCGDNDPPIEAINQILDKMGAADMVIHYLSNMSDRPLGRRWISETFTFLVHIFTGTRLRYYNGINLHKTEILKMYLPTTSGFAYQAEILCQALANGHTYIEIPLKTEPQSNFFTTSALSWKNFLSVVGSLVRMLVHSRYHFSGKSRREN